ncbi:nucleotidyltransferase [Acinetobacter pittii]|uniref:nucleotidyltransferase domain-containing protein n=1 Tax=Acinetobacter pittii TaxID=48296 RepID=UPI001F1F0386|nr:nucleotidyltransferase [Acinetobacter pittii]MCE6234910.1 nucleotidyltransferase [Acinetobacter pittii]MCE6690392.1 nucleotidyltransferase [Acinetobacter pittii]MCE6697116.1 nucleotidyltransferase [Acinetobacter pittii]
MANPQKHYAKFHTNIRLGRYDEESTLREKRDLLISTLKDELKKDPNGPQFVEYFNQGSYALGTGIKPRNGDYDIDVGVLLDCDKVEYGSVEIKKIIRDALTHTNRTVTIKRPCVTVTYLKNGIPDYHVDLPIYTEDDKDNMYLARGKEFSSEDLKTWDISNPNELTNTILGKFENDSDLRHQFRRCTRYLKQWRNEKGLDFFKSIAITSAVYEHITDEEYDNDNKVLLSIVNKLLNEFIHFSIDPETSEPYFRLVINLPAHEGVDLLEKLTKNQMEYLKSKIEDLKSSLEAVNEELDTLEACKILNKTFGTEFPIPEIHEVSEPVTQTYYTQEGKSA